MREIKFRAFIDSKMIEWELLKHIYRMDEIFSGKIHYKIMQFTGLLDKNGKEIYESDVLKIYYEGNQRSYLKKVKWLNDPINKGRWDALDNCVFISCEVVGNIYENPELLEG